MEVVNIRRSLKCISGRTGSVRRPLSLTTTPSPSDLVGINIGGERLVTATRSTFTETGDHMLAAMFSGRHKLNLDPHGRVCLQVVESREGQVLLASCV